MAEKPAEPKKLKSCFVVGPIGEPGSDTRDRADMFLELVVKEALKDRYAVKRADEIAAPGSITEQVINAVIDADLVVADLAGLNPNAFYELGLRHMMMDKPVIHMSPATQPLPFDVKDYRTIHYSMNNPDNIKKAVADLKAQVAQVEAPGFVPSTPVQQARRLRGLRESGDPREREMAELAAQVGELKAIVGQLQGASLQNPLSLLTDYSRTPPRPIDPALFALLSADEQQELRNRAAHPRRGLLSLLDDPSAWKKRGLLSDDNS